jgi:hypothetical protein
MRLSEWRSTTKNRDSLNPKVMAVLEPVLLSLGGESDPHVWIAWGDDPQVRYVTFAPVPAGLVIAHVRVNVPQEGPRVVAKLVRWSRLQPGELSVESQSGHRLLSFAIDQQVMKGVDAEADAVARFALVLLAGIDGRPWPSFDPPTGRGRGAAGRSKRPAAAKAPTSSTRAKGGAGGTVTTARAARSTTRPAG